MTEPVFTDNTRTGNKLRLFVAIACPQLDSVALLLKELWHIALDSGTKVRVVPESNLHITLKFLGPAPRSSIEQVIATLDQLALDASPFNVTLAGGGIFHNALWLGMAPCDPLMRLASDLNPGLALSGFKPESRPFVPHLTLARLRQPAGTQMQTWISQRLQETLGSIRVQEMHLYQSALEPAGARYSILHTATFNGLS